MARSVAKGKHTEEIWRIPCCSVIFLSHIRCLPDTSGLLFIKGCQYSLKLRKLLFHRILFVESLNFEISKTACTEAPRFFPRQALNWSRVWFTIPGVPRQIRRIVVWTTLTSRVVAETFHQYHCFAKSAIGTDVVFQCGLNLELWICHCNSNVGNTGTWHWMFAFVRQPI